MKIMDQNKRDMEDTNKFRDNKRLVLGLLLLIVGGLLLLENTNILPFGIREVVFSWQMLLIGIGIIIIAQKENNASGYIMLGIGLFFLIPDIWHVPHFYRRLFWPSILIIIGVLILLRNTGSKVIYKDNDIDMDSQDFINDTSIFGGTEKKVNTLSFKGGNVTNIFGGSNFDLTDSKLAEGKNVVDFFCLFGGSKFLIPSDWNVKVETTAIMGGFSDKRKFQSNQPYDKDKLLIFKGLVLFGGGEIKNF